jgi:hypothetical protein
MFLLGIHWKKVYDTYSKVLQYLQFDQMYKKPIGHIFFF